jgi:hypothetical protein
MGATIGKTTVDLFSVWEFIVLPALLHIKIQQHQSPKQGDEGEQGPPAAFAGVVEAADAHGD